MKLKFSQNAKSSLHSDGNQVWEFEPLQILIRNNELDLVNHLNVHLADYLHPQMRGNHSALLLSLSWTVCQCFHVVCMDISANSGSDCHHALNDNSSESGIITAIIVLKSVLITHSAVGNWYFTLTKNAASKYLLRCVYNII